MIEQRLEASLISKGYQRMNSNVPDIYLYYLTGDTQLDILSVIRTSRDTVLTKEQYEAILAQLKNNFQASYPGRIRLLSLILTPNCDRDKKLCMDNLRDSHWLIDLSSNRLMIYETQAENYSEMRKMLEDLLDKETEMNEYPNTRKYPDSPETRDSVDGRHKLSNVFLRVNNIIILLNVLAFLVMNFAPILGGEEGMLSKGALSWYYVIEQKEYYRLLTSMFMHADLSHLGNNMLVLFFLGDRLEQLTGRVKYLFIYFSTGILAGITSISYNMWEEQGQFSGGSVFSIGASGAIFGVVGAMLYIVLRNRGRVRDMTVRQMVLFIILSLYGGIANARIDQAAHVGGFLAGIAAAILVYRMPKKNRRERIAV